MILYVLFCQHSAHLRALHSFPTRRSSDLPVLQRSRSPASHAPSPLTAVKISPRGTTLTTPATTSPSTSTAMLTAHSGTPRSEEHTSELQSQFHLVCRLLLEKKKKQQHKYY